MSNWKLLRAILTPRNAMIAATPIAVQSKEQEKDKIVVRPSELPIYVDEIKRQVAPEENNNEVGSLEQAVGTVRRELCTLVSEVNTISNKATEVVKKNLEASYEILDYLKEEENVLPRSGAIALGGLTGFVFGLRGGFFKRLIYMSAGASGIAALCYPKDAEEYFNEGLVQCRKYALIGHHLATSILDDLRGSSSDPKNGTPKEEKQTK